MTGLMDTLAVMLAVALLLLVCAFIGAQIADVVTHGDSVRDLALWLAGAAR